MTTREIVDGVPVIHVGPNEPTGDLRLALWMPPFTQSKESTLPYLQELATLGFHAISFDPWQHGERGIETEEQLVTRIFTSGQFRRSLWPIIGQTTLDAKRVIDWALSEVTDASTVVASGISMGGDIAVALAGIDHRITRVAAIVATPDWTRPGMRSFVPPNSIIEQGDANAYADWFYRTLDPLTHLERYVGKCAISFECAEADTHVPPDGAIRFRDALLAIDPEWLRK